MSCPAALSPPACPSQTLRERAGTDSGNGSQLLAGVSCSAVEGVPGSHLSHVHASRSDLCDFMMVTTTTQVVLSRQPDSLGLNPGAATYHLSGLQSHDFLKILPHKIIGTTGNL